MCSTVIVAVFMTYADFDIGEKIFMLYKQKMSYNSGKASILAKSASWKS